MNIAIYMFYTAKYSSVKLSGLLSIPYVSTEGCLALFPTMRYQNPQHVGLP